MSEQLVGYFYSAPLLDVAYCVAWPWLALRIMPHFDSCWHGRQSWCC